MDGFILVRVDSQQTPADVSYIGMWDTFEEAHDTMRGLYDDEMEEIDMDDTEKSYACRIDSNYAKIFYPHSSLGVTFNIFDAFNDAWINI